MKTLLDGWMKMKSWRGVLVLCLALTLASSPLALSACQAALNEEDAVEADTSDTSETEEVTEEAEAETQEEELSWEVYCEEHSYDTSRCLDRNGDPTAYALWVLPGEYLGALLEERGYVWSARSLMWIKGDGSVALLAVDENGEPVSRDALTSSCPASMAEGDDSFARLGYRIVTSKFSTAKKAFEAIVGKVSAASDVEYMDKAGVGVFLIEKAEEPEAIDAAEATEATETSDAAETTDAAEAAVEETSAAVDANLAFISPNDGTFVVSLFTKQAIENGVFSKIAGRDLGTSADAVFEALAGRTPVL